MLEILVGTNILAIVFGAGVFWQRMSGVEDRIERIEGVLNGLMSRSFYHDAE